MANSLCMKILKNETRFIGYVTLEFSEVEIQALHDMFWQIGQYQNILPEDMKGIRGELYKEFDKLIKPK